MSDSDYRYHDQWQVPDGTLFWIVGASIGSKRLVAQARVTPTYYISLAELDALNPVCVYREAAGGKP
jgi:hypothetical protein